MECQKEKNKQHCNCTYDCETKGLCCECVKYHRERKELPACYFSAETERTFDRSIKNFVRKFKSNNNGH